MSNEPWLNYYDFHVVACNTFIICQFKRKIYSNAWNKAIEFDEDFS